MREGASVPRWTYREYTNASSAFANAPDYVRQRDRTDKTSSEGDHFPTARNFELPPLRAKESKTMPVPKQPIAKQIVWHHENQYTADSACSHCSGVVSHEPWCSTKNLNVRYAFQAVLYPDCLTIQDGLILHALGVAWEGKNR
jgi:hypothetical protein